MTHDGGTPLRSAVCGGHEMRRGRHYATSPSAPCLVGAGFDPTSGGGGERVAVGLGALDVCRRPQPRRPRGSGGGGGGGGGVCESVGKVLGVVWAELVGFIVPLTYGPLQKRPVSSS